MKLKCCTPIRLPPKLDWHLLAPLLGRAREALARYDEILKTIPAPLLEILKWEEAVYTLRAQNINAGLTEILKFSLDGQAEEKRAAMLQKILHAKEALDLACRWMKPLNSAFLCKLHSILKKDAPNPDEIGKFRKRQNWIGEQGCPIEEAYFFPPKARFLSKHMLDWESYARKKEEPLVQLAVLFAQVLIIHTFMDGNGRAARHYIPAFLYRKKLLSKPFLFLSVYFEAHKLQYFQKLFDISEENAWEEWIAYFLKGIEDRSKTMKAQSIRLYDLYQETGDKELFLHPVSLKKRKALAEQSKGLFVFEPLFDAIR